MMYWIISILATTEIELVRQFWPTNKEKICKNDANEFGFFIVTIRTKAEVEIDKAIGMVLK